VLHGGIDKEEGGERKEGEKGDRLIPPIVYWLRAAGPKRATRRRKEASVSNLDLLDRRHYATGREGDYLHRYRAGAEAQPARPLPREKNCRDLGISDADLREGEEGKRPSSLLCSAVHRRPDVRPAIVKGGREGKRTSSRL